MSSRWQRVRNWIANRIPRRNPQTPEPPEPADSDGRPDRDAAWVEALNQVRISVDALSRADADDREARRAESDSIRGEMAAVAEAVLSLEERIKRAGKEQYKANAVNERLAGQVQSVLEEVAQQQERHDAEVGALREQLQGARTEERRQMIEALLPVLDGLDEAVATGERTLAERREQDVGKSDAEGGGWRSILAWRRQSRPLATAQPATTCDLLEGWLHGVALIRDRLLALLADDSVRPIASAGQSFDPHLHRAVETEVRADTAEGTIIREIRRGYLAGESVLRYAEVVVARGQGERSEG